MNGPFLLLGRLENPLPRDGPPPTPKSSAFDALCKATTKLLLPTGNVQVMPGVAEEPRRTSENQPQRNKEASQP